VVRVMPRPPYPRERTPGTHCTGGSLDPRAGLGMVLMRKITSPSRDSNPRAEIKLHILTLALDGGEWSASWPRPLYRRKITPSSHWIGGWLDPRTGLGVVPKRKIPSVCRYLNPRAKIKFQIFSSLALDGGEWLASWPSRFTPSQRAPGTHWIGG